MESWGTLIEGLGPFIIGFLLYASGAIFLTVMLAVGIAWGIRWGITWALKEISGDRELEAWLKRVFSPSEKQINNGILGSTTENRNESN